jgi:hypothetical protein
MTVFIIQYGENGGMMTLSKERNGGRHQFLLSIFSIYWQTSIFTEYIQHIKILESKYGRKVRFQGKKARRGRKEMRLWKGEKGNKQDGKTGQSGRKRVKNLVRPENRPHEVHCS